MVSVDGAQVRAWLREGSEVAILDLREEADYATGHPLWAASFPLRRLATDAVRRLPRPEVTLVLYGSAPGEVAQGREILAGLGFVDVRDLAGGLGGWVAGGGELFEDVNSPSKAFGELVESVRHTPSLSAGQVKALIDGPEDVVVLDVRRFDEFHTMSIPGATSVPGGELVLRVRELAPDPTTRVIVNCAGRTRSIIGTQSLVNAGLPNPVAALRNGTIGWLLADQQLAHGASRRAPAQVAAGTREVAGAAARTIAERAAVRWATPEDHDVLAPAGRTVYRLDVRSREEYVAGHLPGFDHAPGGQLVQEMDHVAPVRGARVVLADDDGVRAAMTGSWLAQMGWDVWVVEADRAAFAERGEPTAVASDAPGDPGARPYRRPYVGTDVAPEVMQAYLDWELGLVAQLGRDGTHNFRVL